MNLQNNEYGKYLIDLKTIEGMHLYYSMKERFEYRVDNRDEIIAEMAHSIQAYVNTFDSIIIPQSSSDFLSKLLQFLDKPYITIQKTSIQDVIEFTNSLNLQKKEKLSHLERIHTMGDNFKINLMKATQRVKYEPILFKNVENLPTKGLIIDDSCFSGTTYRALKNIAPNYQYLAIFAK